MADGFKLTFNPKVENSRLVREGIKGTGPGTKLAQGGKPTTRPAVKGWNPFDWFKGKGKATTKVKPAVKAVTGAIKAAPAAVKGAAVGAAKVVAPIAAGAALGEAYRNAPRVPAVSGRGAGRATFQDSNNNNRPNLQANPNPNDDWADPVAGKGPENNQVGSDADPNTPGLQGSGALKPAAPAKPAEDTRTNANGLVSYGKDLSSLNKFTSAFTGGYELTDIKSAFQSNTLPGAEEYGANRHQLQDTPYELADGATPSNVGGKYTMDGVDTSIQNTGYQISDKSVPGTLGGNPNDPQDGTSSKPDVAESIRQVRMQRKGPRDEGSVRGFNTDRNNAEVAKAQMPEQETGGMYANSKRNKIRSTFLDFDGPSTKAIAAANAVAGFGKDSMANPRFNYGGELVNAKAGMEFQAKDAAMKGLDPTEFLDIPGQSGASSQKSEITPGTITPQENTGGELEIESPILKPDANKFQEAQAFMEKKKGMLTK